MSTVPLPSMPTVESSTIAHIDFEDGTLIVRFKSGQTFRYFDVPQEKYDAMLAADSKGKYFARHIKKKHEGERVEIVATDDYGAPMATGNVKPMSVPKPKGEPDLRDAHMPVRCGTIDL